jgi:hypothetical protein
MAIGTTLKISFDGAQVKRGLTDMKGGMKSLGKSAAIAGAVVIAIGAVLVAAAKKAISMGISINKMGEEAATAEKRLEIMARNTGEFGDQAKSVSDRLNQLAKTTARNIGVDNQSIKQTIAKTLAFRSLAKSAGETGGMFDRVIALSFDMAAATGKTADTLSNKLGKALEDPTRGLTRLIAEGVKFTEEEQEKIKVMAESGRLMESQELILSRLESRYQNVAKETANASERIKEGMDQVRQSFAMGFASAFSGSADSLQPFFESLMEPMKNIGQRVGDAIKAALSGNPESMIQVGVMIGQLISDGMGIALKNTGWQIGASVWRGIERAGRFVTPEALQSDYEDTMAHKSTQAADELLRQDMTNLADSIRLTFRQLADEQRNPNRMTHDGKVYTPTSANFDQGANLMLNGRFYKLLEKIADNTQPAPL